MENLTQITFQRLQDLEYRLEKLKIFAQTLSKVDVSELNTKILTLQAKIDSLSNTISSMQGVDNSVDSRLLQLESDTALNKLQIEEINNLIEDFKCDCSSVEELTARLVNLENSNSDLEEKYNIINTTAQEASNKAVLAEGKIQSLQTDIETLYSESYKIPKLQNELATLSSTVNENNQTVANLQNDISNLEETISNNKTSCEQTASSLQNLENTVNSQNSTIANLQTSNTNANIRITKLEQTEKITNELDFILNGSYILDSDILNIIQGNY